jgi:hypothetical protein
MDLRLPDNSEISLKWRRHRHGRIFEFVPTDAVNREIFRQIFTATMENGWDRRLVIRRGPLLTQYKAQMLLILDQLFTLCDIVSLHDDMHQPHFTTIRLERSERQDILVLTPMEETAKQRIIGVIDDWTQ